MESDEAILISTVSYLQSFCRCYDNIGKRTEGGVAYDFPHSTREIFFTPMIYSPLFHSISIALDNINLKRLNIFIILMNNHPS